ncbi:hypothetical protein CWS72_18995 [Telmatospirillum siberiense]|uniref:Uncharacterized protein n=1 Tax=Telmatospirillum siberiense TaxID=382514 RepID=A0A2N3PRD8_9PROT|nr:hypothetical protein CWS72_18995 [Telmatospirillum siberiense]
MAVSRVGQPDGNASGTILRTIKTQFSRIAPASLLSQVAIMSSSYQTITHYRPFINERLLFRSSESVRNGDDGREADLIGPFSDVSCPTGKPDAADEHGLGNA